MKYWEECEAKVKRLTNGWSTPGSGNKSIKGDVLSGNYCIEVKSTEKDYINLQYSWFKNLYKQYPKKEPLLVVFLGDGFGVCYSYKDKQIIGDKFSSLKVVNKEFPKIIYTPEGTWLLEDLEILKNLDNG